MKAKASPTIGNPKLPGGSFLGISLDFGLNIAWEMRYVMKMVGRIRDKERRKWEYSIVNNLACFFLLWSNQRLSEVLYIGIGFGDLVLCLLFFYIYILF